MRILAEEGASRPACRLVAEALGVEIGISGLSADQMRYRLEGRGEKWQWTDLAGHGPIAVELLSPPAHQPVIGEPAIYEADLPDGRARLVSGHGAEFLVERKHVDTGGILPYCFHAALAQQLARAGVMTLHAAGIATPSGGIIAIGRKGAGKSTLTASALRAGFRVVSDDWLLAAFEGNGLLVQRMRGFMMLRKGWATEQLRKFLPDEFLTESKTRPRLHVFLPEDDARFPAHCHVDRIFVLERGRSGRPERTRSEPLPAAVALGALTESSMPIALSQKLPVERDCLLPGLTRLLARACERVRGGTDLIAAHESAWETLRCPVAGSSTVDPTPERC